MRTYLALQVGRQQTIDVAVEYGQETLVGDLAKTLAPFSKLDSKEQPTIRLEDDHLTLDPSAVVESTPLRSGSAISIVESTSDSFELPRAEAVLEVTSGPAMGQTFSIKRGKNSIGRGDTCTVRIPDQGLSRTHAVIRLSETAAIADAGSKNGTYINGERAEAVRPIDQSDLIMLGNTQFRVRVHSAPSSNGTAFNRPPRAETVLKSREYQVPNPPDPPRKQRIPIAGVFVPLMMSGATFLMSSGSPLSLIFAAISPLMVLARHFESSRTGDRYYTRATAEWSDAMDHLEESRQRTINRESKYRAQAAPSASEVLSAASLRSNRLWERAIDDDDYLTIGAGLAAQTAASVVVKPPQRANNAELEDRAMAVVGVPTVADVPVVLPLRVVGNIGVAASRPAPTTSLTEAAARGLLVQLIGLHSPRDLQLCALIPEERQDAWDWLKWLPHVEPPTPAVTGRNIAIGPDGKQLVVGLTSLVTTRAESSRNTQGAVQLPTVIVVVDERSGVEQARMTTILEQGPAVGVHVIWLGTDTRLLPASCGATIALSASNLSTVTLTNTGANRYEATPDLVSLEAATRFAKDLSPVVDLAASSGGGSIPSTIRLSELIDPSLITDPDTLGQNWQNAKGPLAAPVGATESGPLVLDVRVDGPHGLVAGTTGSGKSEFLQCFVASLAAMHPPSRMAFLFVDYKGGAAFRGCEGLPHSVGMVTDLDAHLVQRVLVSLRAELSRREHILNDAGAKDIIELEKMAYPGTPANLLIVIDEFAALSAEIPEFVDGVVDIAQRGRSLGLHLMLATQRPAGVVTDYIRANMNMRVALRVASTDESVDVIASPEAANLSRDTPGRAVVRLGPGDLLQFQSGFVGAPMNQDESTPTIRVAPFGLGPVIFPPPPKRGGEEGDTELQRFVETAKSASTALSLPSPHRPWLSELEGNYVLEELQGTAGSLAIGISDIPSTQSQNVALLDFAKKGHLLCVGTSGAGKTTLLRSIAAAAELAEDEWWTYGLDFAGRTLRSAEPLPSVGSIIAGDDYERVVRLFRTIRELTDERLEQLGDAGVSDIAELRHARSDLAALPRLLFLLDGLHGFLADYERIDGGKWLDELARLVSDGRPAGLHFAFATDRRSGIPMRLASQIQQNLTLRLATPDDYAMAGLKPEDLGEHPPAGRGILDGVETQIATITGATDGPTQTAALAELAARSKPGYQRPPTIKRLPELVPYDHESQSLFPAYLGIRDRDLAPAAVSDDATLFGIFGPRKSGRTNALHVVCTAMKTRHPETKALLIGRVEDPGDNPWDTVLPNEDSTYDMLRELAKQVSIPHQLLVAVDDYSDITSNGLDDALSLLVPLTRDRRCCLVVADEASLARSAFGSPTISEVRRSKTGLLLSPDTSTDGDLFGINLSKERIRALPGRAVLANRGLFEAIQIAYRTPAESLATTNTEGRPT